MYNNNENKILLIVSLYPFFLGFYRVSCPCCVRYPYPCYIMY